MADFNTAHFPQRKNTDSVKWDNLSSRYPREDLLPMWVADMDFASPPCVAEALRKAADFGVFGYYKPPVSYQNAFLNWEKKRHGVRPQKEWLRFTPGIVTAIYWAISALTAPKDAVAILTPCYYPFMDAVQDTGRTLICSDLIRRGNGYEPNMEDLEEKIRTHHVKMLLLCSPHNPVGRVWSKAELYAILTLCNRYNVIVVSDEIHQDITFNGSKHYSCLHFEEYLQQMIVLTSASKTFNIAGLQNSFAIIPNAGYRTDFDAYVKTVRIKKGVSLGYIATEAAYSGGEAWLEEVLVYLKDNYNLLKTTLTDALPQIKIDPLEGTYMIWVDISAYVKPEDVEAVVQDGARIAVDYGHWFWPKNQIPEGDAHIRINIATARNNIQLAAQRLVKAIQDYRK